LGHLGDTTERLRMALKYLRAATRPSVHGPVVAPVTAEPDVIPGQTALPLRHLQPTLWSL
jgi:hypothetical protein